MRLFLAAVFFARNSSEIFLAAEIRRGIHPVDSYSQNVSIRNQKRCVIPAATCVIRVFRSGAVSKSFLYCWYPMPV